MNLLFVSIDSFHFIPMLVSVAVAEIKTARANR